MVIFLRRLTIRGQPKKWGDKSERLLTKRATHPIDPNPSVEFLHSGPTLSYDIFVFCFYEAASKGLPVNPAWF